MKKKAHKGTKARFGGTADAKGAMVLALSAIADPVQDRSAFFISTAPPERAVAAILWAAADGGGAAGRSGPAQSHPKSSYFPFF